MKSELMQHLEELQGGTIIKCSAGGGAGSIILMDVTSRSGVLYTLWIECCWRIENSNKVIATSADDIEPITGLIAKSAKKLEKLVIQSVALNSFYDLCIEFSEEFYLRLFCIFSNENDCDVNWWLSIPSKNLCYEVTNLFKVEKGKYVY